jgi:hypothetical protein
VPIDRDPAKDDAEAAIKYYARLKAKGTFTEDQLNQFTVAWILSRRVDATREERPEWDRE